MPRRKTGRSRGRPKGSGPFIKTDDELCIKVAELMLAGATDVAAVYRLTNTIGGHTENLKSRRERVRKKFRRQRERYLNLARIRARRPPAKARSGEDWIEQIETNWRFQQQLEEHVEADCRLQQQIDDHMRFMASFAVDNPIAWMARCLTRRKG